MSVQSEIDRINGEVSEQSELISQIKVAVEGMATGGESSGDFLNVTPNIVSIYIGDYAYSLKCSCALLNHTELIIHTFPETGMNLDGFSWSGIDFGTNIVDLQGSSLTLDTITTLNHYHDGTYSASESVSGPTTPVSYNVDMRFDAEPNYIGQGSADYISFLFKFTIS